MSNDQSAEGRARETEGTAGTTVEQSAETTDILPTLAGMIGVPIQAGSIDGHCLKGVPGATCPAR